MTLKYLKKMITTGMLREQAWMADDDDFDQIIKNSQRVLGLNIQYENHPYVEEFTKQCNVMFIYGTYALEGEAGSKQTTNNNFCRQMINCMKAWNYLQKTSDIPLNTEIIKQTHKIMMDGNDVLTVEYRKSREFAGYHI